MFSLVVPQDIWTRKCEYEQLQSDVEMFVYSLCTLLSSIGVIHQTCQIVLLDHSLLSLAQMSHNRHKFKLRRWPSILDKLHCWIGIRTICVYSKKNDWKEIDLSSTESEKNNQTNNRTRKWPHVAIEPDGYSLKVWLSTSGCVVYHEKPVSGLIK